MGTWPSLVAHIPASRTGWTNGPTVDEAERIAKGLRGGEVSQGNRVQAVPSHDEVERAIRSVPGVAEATVARSQETGRGRLRIRLHPGEDAERVSWSVAATLRERFGIALDPEEIRPRVSDGVAQRPPAEPVEVVDVDSPTIEDLDEPTVPGEFEPPATPEVPVGASDATEDSRDELSAPRPTVELGTTNGHDRTAWRPAIRDLSSRNDGVTITVTARLEHHGRMVAGEASGAPTTRGLRQAIAAATVAAVAELTRNPLRAQVDRVSVGGADPASVSVVVSLLSGRGEELLLGAAIVRDDVEHAVMRATLDALNRRVEPDLV